MTIHVSGFTPPVPPPVGGTPPPYEDTFVSNRTLEGSVAEGGVPGYDGGGGWLWDGYGQSGYTPSVASVGGLVGAAESLMTQTPFYNLGGGAEMWCEVTLPSLPPDNTTALTPGLQIADWKTDGTVQAMTLRIFSDGTFSFGRSNQFGFTPIGTQGVLEPFQAGDIVGFEVSGTGNPSYLLCYRNRPGGNTGNAHIGWALITGQHYAGRGAGFFHYRSVCANLFGNFVCDTGLYPYR